jgi:hypothetical protein
LVSNNRLASVPASVERCVNLRQLWLSNNRLTELPDGIGLLPLLESLFVNANALTSPPRLPPSLVSLDVSGNRLKDLCFLGDDVNKDKDGGGGKGGENGKGEGEGEGEPPPLPPPPATLRDVYAMGNRISRLDPRAFACCDSLQRLYLGSNALDDVGVGAATWTALGGLRALEALDLSGNPGLKTVHPGLDALWRSGGDVGDVSAGGGGGGGVCRGGGGSNCLRVLDLRGTGVTEAAFAAACPSLTTAAAEGRRFSGSAGGGGGISDSDSGGNVGDGGVEIFFTGGVGGCYGAFGGADRGGDSGGGGGGTGAGTGGGGSDGGGGVGWPGGLAPGEEPPLEHQLASLTTAELQTRLMNDHGVSVDPARSRRPECMLMLCSRLRQVKGRAAREVRGEPVPESLTVPLLAALRGLEWPTQRERGNVSATRYITLSRGDFDHRMTEANEGEAAEEGGEKKQSEKKNVSKRDAKLAKLFHYQARYRHLWELASAVGLYKSNSVYP